MEINVTYYYQKFHAFTVIRRFYILKNLCFTNQTHENMKLCVAICAFFISVLYYHRYQIFTIYTETFKNSNDVHKYLGKTGFFCLGMTTYQREGKTLNSKTEEYCWHIGAPFFSYQPVQRMWYVLHKPSSL